MRDGSLRLVNVVQTMTMRFADSLLPCAPREMSIEVWPTMYLRARPCPRCGREAEARFPMTGMSAGVEMEADVRCAACGETVTMSLPVDADGSMPEPFVQGDTPTIAAIAGRFPPVSTVEDAERAGLLRDVPAQDAQDSGGKVVERWVPSWHRKGKDDGTQ